MGSSALRVMTGLWLSLLCTSARADTWLTDKAKDTRDVAVLRTFTIPVVKGEKNMAALPAMMSFWGATNHQEILKSAYTYSVKPDEVAITADNRGAPHRNHELTWNSPPVDTIIVTQKLAVRLTSTNRLYTAARLPYTDEVRKFFAASLAGDEDMNPANAELDPICESIKGKAKRAEEAVELVCDWINGHIEFESGAPAKSDTVLKRRKGNCLGMAHLACALLRKIGIPAEAVPGKFIRSTGGHCYMEVYFPDAGWVFYDLSNGQRGFKEINCLMTVGHALRVENSKGDKYHYEGLHRADEDVSRYDAPEATGVRVRRGPQGKMVLGVRVVPRATPPSVKVRHRSLSQLILDLTVPPGKRKYQKVTLQQLIKRAADAAKSEKTESPTGGQPNKGGT